MARKSSELNTIDEIGPLSVPVDGLSASKTFKVKVPVPSGADRVSPKTVSVTVKIVKGNQGQSGSDTSDQSKSDQTTSGQASNQETQGSTSFQNIPIHIQGLSSNKRAAIQPGSVSVKVEGSQSDLNGLSASDIQASVNVAGLSNGTHQVKIQLRLPRGLTGEATPKSAKVTISDKQKTST
ncbi:CdaR family protein [Terrilactibacillus sp. S3-3]|nr:CdaR family protein [Terrilactibacillus sp. S3-3]